MMNRRGNSFTILYPYITLCIFAIVCNLASSEPCHAASDPYCYLGITLNPDGSITRRPSPTIPPSTDPSSPVFTKDVPINEQTNILARLYLPSNTTTKLPLIVYYFGGGFVLGSAFSSTSLQEFCNNVVLKTPAIMVSVNYRLAPEHRLPAAYVDSFEALRWLRTTKEEWLTKFADFSKCVILGSSSGGNIVYHVGLHAAGRDDQLAPLKIGALALQQPFFGGVQRTPSEKRAINDEFFPPAVSDVLWNLSLPIGTNRDYYYSNPAKHVNELLVQNVRNEGWKVLVTGTTGDPMVDRQMEVAKLLAIRGVAVKQHFVEGGHHGFDPNGTYAISFYEVFKKLVHSL